MKETQRYYTCQKCKKSIRRDNGKNNPPRTQSEVQRSTTSRKFENRCRDCNRDFRNPIELKEHRNYICTQRKKKRTTGSITLRGTGATKGTTPADARRSNARPDGRNRPRNDRTGRGKATRGRERSAEATAGETNYT